MEDIDRPDITIADLKTEMKRYTYFFLAPTLVYRDRYVMNKRVRVGAVLQNLFTMIVLILYLWSIVTALCIPIFKDTAENPGNLR